MNIPPSLLQAIAYLPLFTFIEEIVLLKTLSKNLAASGPSICIGFSGTS